MKNFGPNSPRTVRGLLERRKPRGVMDTRWHQEADIVTAPMSSPFGKGFHELKSPAGTRYLVADQTGGRTFAPDTEVMVAVPQGLHNKAVLGGAPANKKGGATRTRSSRRRGTVVLDANQYAFGVDGLGSMLAMLYSDGTYVSTRATETEVGGSHTGCILTDSSLLVGDGSLLLKDGDTLKVWDVEGAIFYTYSVPGGWLGSSPPYYQNGFLYWCEIEDVVGETTFDVRLRKSDTDFGNVSTLSTFTSPDAVADYGVPWLSWRQEAQILAFAVDADGAICYTENRVTDEADANEWHGLQIRFLLSGSNSFREFTTPELGVDGTNLLGGNPLPCVTIGTTSFAIAQPIDGVQSVLSKADDASTPAANLWGASDLDSTVVSALSVGTGGSVVQVHSTASGNLLRGVGSGTVITSAIDAFDAVPNYPTAMFYFGE